MRKIELQYNYPVELVIDDGKRITTMEAVLEFAEVDSTILSETFGGRPFRDVSMTLRFRGSPLAGYTVSEKREPARKQVQ